MAFGGFTSEAFEFYEGLQADNSKSYWTAHRETYERHVREPMEELCAELEDEFGPVKLFRPYRDLRFSKDKSPYKTHQGGHTSEGFYLQLDADGLMVAGGMYAPTPEQLRRYREAVDSETHGGELQAVLDDLSAAGMEIAGDRLKTRPRGTPPDHPRLELLRHRSLYAREGWPADPWMADPDAVVTRVRESWRRLRPLVDWGRRHIGPPDSPG
ncbi:uncharacterized protein (TIGR02453 family) [Actinomadura hallensis]|jgi:uncharacterized protein (TIGR02453 family)|uniref:Uncharacterized protein (TIGR02453 family) n=1 Tax=Actinomadura hallensis TaxID=337895 RepID=A0A543IJ19_9ACTN|nr:DUF2461 domain-containing protein [Actinomadura hallensis]TQM70578.1 uncharacterized protein (TIGR02453 family) [Actinomadura hallensis]